MRKKTAGGKKSWLRPSARSKCELGERGFFGLGALASIGVMIAISLAVGTAIALALPYITETLAEGLNLGPLLIHIPEMQGTFWATSSPVSEPSGIFYMSKVMGDLYGTIMTISFAVLLIAFVLVGLFYALEQFRVVGEGTASTILSESVFIIILIFIFPLLFNGAAAMINGIDEGIIMHHVDDEGNVTTYDAMVVDVARYAGTVPGLLEKEMGGIPLIGDIPNMMSKAITVLITSSVSLIAIFTAFATGVFKVLAIAVLAAAFPLILALRLIPFTRSVSTRLTGAFIGLLLASIVMALFFRVAWGVLEYGGLGEVMLWALGCGTLIAVTAAFTITAPALSGMATAIGHTIGRGVAAPTAGLIAGGVTTGLAMVPAAGMATGMGVSAGLGARGVLGTTTRGMGRGALAGGPAKEPFGAVSAGIGVGRTGATEKDIASRMGLKDDIQKTTNTFIHGKGMGEKMENFEVARADLAKDPDAYRDACESGGEVASNIDKWGDNEAYDAFGRADRGTAYDPKVHRKIYQASDLKPYEIKQGAKLAHSKIAGNSRYGPDGANLAMKFIRDGKIVYPGSGRFRRGKGMLMFPPRGK